MAEQVVTVLLRHWKGGYWNMITLYRWYSRIVLLKVATRNKFVSVTFWYQTVSPWNFSTSETVKKTLDLMLAKKGMTRLESVFGPQHLMLLRNLICKSTLVIGGIGVIFQFFCQHIFNLIWHFNSSWTIFIYAGTFPFTMQHFYLRWNIFIHARTFSLTIKCSVDGYHQF